MSSDSTGILDAVTGALRVHAVGVNFRDVLNVLGAYPGDPGPPGADCAGVWADNVAGTGAGEGAFGMAAGSLGTLIYASLLVMPPKPSEMSFEAAATTPTVFVTVQVALQSAMGMGSTRSLLVHAVAGGIGLAASQLSGAFASKCMGSAGGPNKRVVARTTGVEHAVGSRDTRYADALACADGGSFS